MHDCGLTGREGREALFSGCRDQGSTTTLARHQHSSPSWVSCNISVCAQSGLSSLGLPSFKAPKTILDRVFVLFDGQAPSVLAGVGVVTSIAQLDCTTYAVQGYMPQNDPFELNSTTVVLQVKSGVASDCNGTFPAASQLRVVDHRSAILSQHRLLLLHVATCRFPHSPTPLQLIALMRPAVVPCMAENLLLLPLWSIPVFVLSKVLLHALVATTSAKRTRAFLQCAC